MSFRDVLVVLRPYPAGTSDSAVEYAVRMSRTLEARTSVIACAVSAKVPQSILGNSLVNLSGMVHEEGRKSAEDAKRLISLLEHAVKTGSGILGDRFCLSRPSSEIPSVLAEHARMHDLTILPMPEGDYVSQFDAQWYAETVMFNSGLPTLVLPQHPKSDIVALETVVVAWDKSRPAARTVADAIPVLKKAKKVRILTVQGDKHISSEPPTTMMAQHLERHGINVCVDEVQAGRRSIGEILREQVHASAADLLVMGAYGQSRFREFILGGATKSMLTHPPVPVFLSH